MAHQRTRVRDHRSIVAHGSANTPRAQACSIDVAYLLADVAQARLVMQGDHRCRGGQRVPGVFNDTTTRQCDSTR